MIAPVRACEGCLLRRCGDGLPGFCGDVHMLGPSLNCFELERMLVPRMNNWQRLQAFAQQR